MTDSIWSSIDAFANRGDTGQRFEAHSSRASGGSNSSPEFTNFPDGGAVQMKEGREIVHNFDSRDAQGEARSYSIRGGEDSALFNIDRSTGMLRFNSAPSHNPGGDNTYHVEVVVTDESNNSSSRMLTVQVEPEGDVSGRTRGGTNSVVERSDGKTLVTFNGLDAGTVVSDQIPGLSIFATRPGSNVNAAMIFDGANPTGGDTDLATITQGKLLIVSEDDDSSDPDDNAGGGTFHIGFDSPAEVESLRVLDIEERGGEIRLYDANDNLIKTVRVLTTGDNGTRNLHIDAQNVSRMEVELVGSGAIDDLCFKGGGVVAPDNTPPAAGDDAAVTNQDQPVDIIMLDNDSDDDGDMLTITEVNGQPITNGSTVDVPNGTVRLNPDGSATFTPNPGFNGRVDFPYTVDDGRGGQDTATVTVMVNPPDMGGPGGGGVDSGGNQVPDALDDVGSTVSPQPVTISVLANDSDPDGDALTVTQITSPPSNGRAIVNVDGTITYIPNPGFVGADEFDYEVSDGNGGTDIATVRVDVGDGGDGPGGGGGPDPEPNPNAPPTAVNDQYFLKPGVHYVLPILENDSDPEGDPLTITAINDQPIVPGQSIAVQGGVLTVRSDGRVVFKGDRGVFGFQAFTYTITDGNGGTSTARVDICLVRHEPK